MDIALLVVVAVLGLALIGARFVPSFVLRRRCRREVIVTLKSATAFRGVLYEADGAVLVLRDAVALVGEQAPVDGEVLIRWDEVDFLQRP